MGSVQPTNKNETPWLNRHNCPLRDEDLINVTKSWDRNQWESYLTSLEIRLSETLLSENEFQRALDQQTESIFTLTCRPCTPEDSSSVWGAMRILTPRQREVIHLTYWRNCSEREISGMLGISRATVRTLHKRGLRKLMKHLQVRGPINSSKTRPATKCGRSSGK